MASVTLDIGGHHYSIGCAEGEEPRFQALAALIDAKTKEVQSSAAGVNQTRQMLFTALLLADELDDLRKRAPGNMLGDTLGSAPTGQQVDAKWLTAVFSDIASRLEMVASTLENSSPENPALENPSAPTI
jgi:cell division protein ZapA